MKEMKVHIQGMTCASCEIIIERKLRKISGVDHVSVSREKGEAVINCANHITLENLQAAVADKGYVLCDKKSDESFFVNDKKKYWEILVVLGIVFVLYLFMRKFDLLPNGFSVTENMSYGFIFTIGLVAATSSCLAVSGGLLLAVATKYNELHPTLTSYEKMMPHLYFNIGRIFSYTLFGGFIGFIGSEISLSLKMTGIIIVITSVLMIFMGIQLLQIFPGLHKFQFKLPKSFAHHAYSHAEKKGRHASSAFLFGMSTFFLPCGFTQALQLYVLSKGDFVTGALTMLVFSLGTLPALAGIGAFSSFAKGNVQRHFMTFAAVLIIVLGVFNISNGLALSGVALKKTVVDVSPITIVDGKQIILMKIDGLTYTPDHFTVEQGVPVEWHIDSTDASGCAHVVTLPTLKITELLPSSGEKIIRFTPDKLGKIPFSCPMGMTTRGASFTVISNAKQTTGELNKT